MSLFPFADYWWFYGGFLVFVSVILTIDLGVFNRRAHVVSFKEATIWSIIWGRARARFNYAFINTPPRNSGRKQVVSSDSNF